MPPRPLAEIIAHIRSVCDNASVDATLIQTEDLYVLCDAADEIELLTAALNDERKAHQVCVEMRDKAYADIDRIIAVRGPITFVPQDRPRDDGTVVAVGGEPGANAGKSE